MSEVPVLATETAIAATPAPTRTARPTPTPDPPLRSDGMRLAGSVPGSNADFAFWGDLAVVTNVPDWDFESADDGVSLIDIADPANPRVVGRFACPGAFQDVSVWGDIVVISQDRIRASDDCGAAAGSSSASGAFAGLRIVSIADPASPVLLASVPTGVEVVSGSRNVRGSHTSTIVPDLDNDRLLIYAGMFFYPGSTPDASIVAVPLDDPGAAQVVGAFDNRSEMTCHDVTVFLPRRLAACNSYGDGTFLFDIADLVSPKLVGHVTDEEMQINESFHSAVFSNDGTTLVVNAEIFDGDCPGGSASNRGAPRFFDITDPAEPKRLGVFQLPRSTLGHFCYAHQSNIVPVADDRDLLVSGWFGGGVNLIDFTNPGDPRELAFWVSGEPGGRHSFVASAYWYNGRIYAANLSYKLHDHPATQRGFEIFGLDDGIVSGAITLPSLNPQTQLALPLP